LQGGRSKVMMARFSIRVGVGHHHAHITCPTPPMGTALDYRVHHFKWKADLIERTLAWADQPNASAGWKADSRNFLKWWRACGERLDLSQPILGARNLGAPATMGPLTTQQMLELALREHQARRLEAAEAIYQQVLAVQPNQQDALNLLGVMAHQRGQYDQAVQWIARAISARPTEAAFFVNLGLALTGQKKSDEAIAAFGHAVRLRPDHADALNYLADAHMAAGEMASAVDYWRRAGEARPANAAWGSDLLYAMNFDPRQDAQAIARAGREWDRRHGEPLRASISSHESSREPNRKLRIGYLSQDLKVHVVGFNLLPLLARHDHNQFEIFCYSSSETSDEVTEHLKMCASGWRQIHSTPDAAVADMIRQDKIDILVDLSLHTRGNRLLVMARRPAPVQATYLGCLSSTGLSAIDYRISDPYLDPPETDVSVYSERTIRLPATYWCYHIHEVAPPVAPAPAERNGLVTFGCLNHYCKISDAALELWTLVLRAVPQSRLLVYSDSDRQRRTIAARLAAGGITTDRLEIVGRVKRSEYLARYHRIDMVLDTLPFAGGITTCDALWMGVPVVTLRGRTVAGRGSCSVLSNAGLTELIASTPREYVNIAANWRTWSGRRNELRPRMQDSPLVDAQRFARDMEAAYRRMWTNYCESGR
ncbi:MAG TPA: tetratricopeptide repeat protein, partial [Tepidisphaeraceae bacterium]|nr:tetratricopeptide repeat protein [Tepidisphaeraceae bacterium]